MYGVDATREREVKGEKNLLDGPHHAISARPVRGVTSAIRVGAFSLVRCLSVREIARTSNPKHGAASHVSDKAVFERFLGAEEPGFRGGGRNRERCGSFFKRPIPELFEFDNNSEVPRQGSNCFVQECLFVFLREQRFGVESWIFQSQVFRSVVGEP